MNRTVKGIDNLLDNVLCIQKSDKILIASDPEREELVREVSMHLDERDISYSVMSIDYDGKRIPAELSEKLLDDEHNVVLLFFGKSIWHQKERRDAKYVKMKRMAAYSGTLEMLEEGPALADPGNLEILIEDLKKHIVKGTTIRLEGPNGTDISGKCSSIGFESGLYAKPGDGGNFPSGEAYSFNLIEDTVKGSVHSNIKVKHLGLSALGNDAIFEVRQGKIFPVDDRPAEKFFLLIENDEELHHVGELAFGLCPYNRVFDYPDSIQEEKILGTAHVGLGSNISFGGTRKGRHLDLVFGPATVTVDGKRIIIDGKINQEYLSEESKEWIRTRDMLYIS
ncbi:MAG: hypothetical protein KAR23_02310 [Candidatus Aenigmarchaeota archaeon]|nr:hypothetical protein [Candidatus Aenigmarchaeota archaeon]